MSGGTVCSVLVAVDRHILLNTDFSQRLIGIPYNRDTKNGPKASE